MTRATAVTCRTVVTLALFATALLGACSKAEPGKTPSGGKISCVYDSDCVVVNHTGCCSCCDGPPVAVPKAEQARAETKCAAMDCKTCSASIECAKVEAVTAFIAKCTDGTCAALHN